MGTVALVVLLVVGPLMAVAAAAWRLLVVVTVHGTSMQPRYQPGDRVLVRRRFADRAMRRGDVVVVRPFEDTNPEDPLWMVKRVAARGGDPVPSGAPTSSASPASASSGARVPHGHVYVLGDGPGSVDSRRFGPVPESRVLGRVVTVLLPATAGGDSELRRPPAEPPGLVGQ